MADTSAGCLATLLPSAAQSQLPPQEKANVIAAQADAALAVSDDKRYQAVGNMAVSQSQLDLANTHAHASRAQVDAARNKELAAEATNAKPRFGARPRFGGQFFLRPATG